MVAQTTDKSELTMVAQTTDKSETTMDMKVRTKNGIKTTTDMEINGIKRNIIKNITSTIRNITSTIINIGTANRTTALNAV
jgi:polyribonucleotide nucleotidyltransferase